MAFDATNFGPIGGQARRGKQPQLWSYKTEDTAATVDTAGYFSSMYNSLEIGDLIYRCTTSSGAFSTAGLHVVKDKASGAIDVVDATALTTTDTD